MIGDLNLRNRGSIIQIGIRVLFFTIRESISISISPRVRTGTLCKRATQPITTFFGRSSSRLGRRLSCRLIIFSAESREFLEKPAGGARLVGHYLVDRLRSRSAGRRGCWSAGRRCRRVFDRRGSISRCPSAPNPRLAPHVVTILTGIGPGHHYRDRNKGHSARNFF